MDTITTADDLLSNEEFVKLARLDVPSRILNEYAPDRSLRWVQSVAKTARESSPYNYEASAPKATTSPATKRYHIPDSPVREETGWMRLEGDYAVVSDVHVPFHSAMTLENLMHDAESMGVKSLIIAGDLVDGNQWNFRRGSQFQRRAQDDVEQTRGVLSGLLEYFSTIKVFMGNHDVWLAEYLRNHFDADFLYRSFFKEFSSRVEWSKYGHCDLSSGGTDWKILHGANFSESNPVGVAKKLAEKFRANIIVGHQHRVEESYGQYHCVCLGGVLDSSRMAYLQHQPTTGAIPRRSYAIVKDGKCHHIIEDMR